MRVALYLRVSTGEQSVEPQRRELLEVCARRGWSEPREFADRASGAKWTRFGLDALMAEVRRGKIDVILCAKLDRLGRSLPHLAQIIGELDAHGTALVCTSQAIDTTAANPAGRLVMGVLMAVAEFERTLIVERTRAGLAVARASGKRLGRPPVLALTREHAAIVSAWAAEEPRPAYKALAERLGCSLGKAHRLGRAMLGPVDGEARTD